jgi:hypothetical protein
VTVEDRVLIRDLYDRVYIAMNEGDVESFTACFAPGGHLTKYNGEVSTPELSAATGVKWSGDPIGRTYQHHVTNCLVLPDLEGRPDFRRVRMYFLVTGVFDPPEIVVRWSCKADDVVQKIDGAWLFVARRISLNHDATGPHYMTNEPPHATQP